MKYYAVKYKSGETKIFHDTWENVKGKVDGHKGVMYKGFDNKKDLTKWLDKINIKQRKPKDGFDPQRLYIFTDGSYSKNRGTGGWGWVAIKNGEEVKSGYGETLNNLESRNVSGEVRAVIEAVKWFLYSEYKGSPTSIVYDYIGIGMWLLKLWKANTNIAQELIDEVGGHTHHFQLEKVGGHKGIEGNERADELSNKYRNR